MVRWLGQNDIVCTVAFAGLCDIARIAGSERFAPEVVAFLQSLVMVHRCGHVRLACIIALSCQDAADGVETGLDLVIQERASLGSHVRRVRFAGTCSSYDKALATEPEQARKRQRSHDSDAHR